MDTYTVKPIGTIRSELVDRSNAPLQGDEGGYEAWLDLNPEMEPGLLEMNVGDQLVVLTWLHQAQRDVLQLHPRNRPNAPLKGVFSTRSQDRPNPIGLHRVQVLEITGHSLRVVPMEAIHGTPIIDIKPVLKGIDER